MKRTYTLEDLFPACCLPDCTDTSDHAHILPKQLEIMEWGNYPDPEVKSFLYAQGGVGSAKSVAFAARVVDEMLIVPNNEGVVVRKDYKLLYKSSWKDVKACIKRLVVRDLIDPPVYSDKRQGDYTTITFNNGSILYALQAKNWSEGLGASYGIFWVDDAMEVQEELFIGDETSVGLVSRLRLPYVRNYKDSNGNPENHLVGLVSSNPPPIGNWLHKLFGKEPGIYKLGDDQVKVMLTDTNDNPFVGAGYAKTLIAIQHKMGRDKTTIARVIHGKSLPAYGGIKVFPKFSHARHVGHFTYDPNVPLIRGWDFGFQHPAVVFSNLIRCEKNNYHYRSLSEISDMTSVSIYQLYHGTETHLGVKGHTARYYSNSNLIVDGGDKAGDRSSDTDKDKRGPVRILWDEDKVRVVVKHLNLVNSIEYMRSLLERTCPCGLSYIQIDVSCEVLIGALEGGYKYPRKRDGTTGDKPVEDRFYADVACAWRYGAENYVRHGLPVTKIVNPSRTVKTAKPAWAWMDMSLEEIAKTLTN